MDAPTVVPKPPRYNLSQHNPIPSAQSQNPNGKDASFSFHVKPEEDEPEISIFDAHKYFCENNVVNVNSRDPSGPRLSSVSSGSYGRNFRTRSFHATPTPSSEASWNSQTGLLVNPPVTMKPFASNDDDKSNLRRKEPSKKWVFGRKCCCTCKKSVRVKEATTTAAVGPVESKNGGRAKSDALKGKAISSRYVSTSDQNRGNKISTVNARVLSSPEEDFASVDQPRQQRISASRRPFLDGSGRFLLPILKNPTHSVRPGPKGICPLGEDPPRVSLEVFKPAENSPASDVGRPFLIQGSPTARVVSADDDLGSDASSDLFELESFSTQTTSYPMHRRRHSLDEPPIFNARRFESAVDGGQYDRRGLDEPLTPSVAATECYAPTEVSINWSVTTAEGCDRASVSNFSISASEAGGAAFLRQRQQEDACVRDGRGRKGSGGGILLMSCRQEKAVSVGP